MAGKLTDTNFDEHRRKFERASMKTGARGAARRSNLVAEKIRALAHRMLEAPALTAEGLGMQAAAALTFDDTFEFHLANGDRCFPAQLHLWVSAYAAGFPVPAWVRKFANEKKHSHARLAGSGKSPRRRAA